MVPPGRGSRPPSEVALPLAVLHGGFAGPVVGPGGPRSVIRVAAISAMISSTVAGARLDRAGAGRCRRPCGSAPSPRTRPRRRPAGDERAGRRAACRRARTPRACGRSRWTGSRAPRAGCSARCRARSSSTAGTPGCARPAGSWRCRGSTARGAGSWGPTGRTRRGTRTPAPWPWPSPRRGGPRRTPRRTGCSASASSSVVVCSRLRLAHRPVSSTTRPESMDSWTRGDDQPDAELVGAPVTERRAPRRSCARCRRA